MAEQFILMRRDCISKLQMHENYQRKHPSPNNVGYWKNFVEDYYDLEAVEKLCFALCEPSEIDITSDSGVDSVVGTSDSGDNMVGACVICGSSSKKHYETNTRLLPHVLKSKFDAGLVDEFLSLCEPEAEALPTNGNIQLEYKEVVRHMIYKNFAVLHKGILRLVFKNNVNVKILSRDFCIRSLEVRPTPSCATYVRLASTTQGKAEIKSVTEYKTEMESILDNCGLPKSYRRLIQMEKNFSTMKDLMDYSLRESKGAKASLEMYVADFHLAQNPDIIPELERELGQNFMDPEADNAAQDEANPQECLPS